MDDFWQIWKTNTPEEGPQWQNLVMTLSDESNAIRLCTAVECPYPGGNIWHIVYTDGVRTATQVTY